MESFGNFLAILVVSFLAVVPSAWARKCYVCDSSTYPQCIDAYQISNNYQDCSTSGGYGGSYAGSQYPPQQPGFPGQQGGFGQPQQLGQVGQPGGYQNYGGVGGDRCTKVMIVGAMPNGQPRVIRACGNQNGMQGDGCFWTGNVMTCTCNSNYCNGSSRLSTASLSAILVACVATIVSHLYRSSL